MRVRNDALLDSLTGRIAIRSNGGDHSITLSADIVAPVMPDLVVDRLAVNGDRSPTRFTVGDTVDIRASVTNIGGGSAGASQLEYQIGGSVRGQPFGTDSVRSLEPNKTSDKSHRYTFTEADVGIRQFRLIADRDSVVDERDESNNVRLTDPFEVVLLPPPDLVVQSVTFNGSPQPDDFTVGDTVSIRVMVGNIGSGNAAGSELAYHIGGSFHEWVIDTDNIRSLRPRMTAEESTTYTFTQDDIGTRHFRLVVDHHTEIDEQDESNNAHISSPFRVVAPRANVAPTASRVSPSQRTISLSLGSTQAFRAQGADPDGNISSITWLVEGRVESGLSLDLTGSVTRSFAHTFNAAGDYLVKAVFTDANGASDSVIWDVEVPLPPRIVSLGCFPEEVDTGEEVSCSATLAGGPPSRYLWASIGGNPRGGEVATFSTHWDSPGNQQVVLEVCNDGGCHSRMETIVVEAPITPADLRVYSNGPIVPGSTIEVKGSGFPSAADVDTLELGSISLLRGLKRTADGNGQFTIAASVPTLEPGSYALVARVGDITARSSITIEESPLSNPCQSVHRDSPENEVLEFRAGGTQIFYARINAQCGHVESIQWNINGEELRRTQPLRPDLDLFEHRFDRPGVFKVEVVAFDSVGRFASTHWNVRVGPPPIEMGPHDVHQGRFSGPEDRLDVYQVYVKQGHTLHVKLTDLTGTGDFNLHLRPKGVMQPSVWPPLASTGSTVQRGAFGLNLKKHVMGKWPAQESRWYEIGVSTNDRAGRYELRTFIGEARLQIAFQDPVPKGLYIRVEKRCPDSNDWRDAKRSRDVHPIDESGGQSGPPYWVAFDLMDFVALESCLLYPATDVSWRIDIGGALGKRIQDVELGLKNHDEEWRLHSVEVPKHRLSDWETVWVPLGPETDIEKLADSFFRFLYEDELISLRAEDADGFEKGLAGGSLGMNFVGGGLFWKGAGKVGGKVFAKVGQLKKPIGEFIGLDRLKIAIKRSADHRGLESQLKNIEEAFTRTWNTFSFTLKVTNRMPETIRDMGPSDVGEQIGPELRKVSDVKLDGKDVSTLWSEIYIKLQWNIELTSNEVGLYRELQIAAAVKKLGMELPDNWLRRGVQVGSRQVTDLDVVARVPDGDLVTFESKGSWQAHINRDRFRRGGVPDETLIRDDLRRLNAAAGQSGTKLLVIVAEGSPSQSLLTWMHRNDIHYVDKTARRYAFNLDSVIE